MNGNAERGMNVGLYWLLAVNDFYDIVSITRDDPYLIDLLGVLLGFHLNGQHRGFDDTAFQAFLAPANGLDGVNKDIPTFRFVLIPGQSWASGELRGVFIVGCSRLEEALPGLIELVQHFLCHLRRQCFVRFMRLHALVHLGVVEVLALMNKGLSYLV